MLHLARAALALAIAAVASSAAAEPARYAWPTAPTHAETLAQRFPPPPGFQRVPAAPGSWAAWLRALPLEAAGAPVLLYTGAPKWRQDVHAAVIDIDVGDRDLQQCADAILRLRGEWLFASGRAGEIHFNDTDGKRRTFKGRDYAAFRKYMNVVFAYAGTYSLEHELKPVPLSEISIGDVFIKGGFPGHAVLVADMVESPATGERRFLLIQSYMPAQQMHVLKNPATPAGSPWYPAAFEGPLVTPEWTFAPGSLRRWPERPPARTPQRARRSRMSEETTKVASPPSEISAS
jgi:hypothetical protein